MSTYQLIRNAESSIPHLIPHLTSTIALNAFTLNQGRLSGTPEQREDDNRPACIAPHRSDQKRYPAKHLLPSATAGNSWTGYGCNAWK
jgi:hypothetical protein